MILHSYLLTSNKLSTQHSRLLEQVALAATGPASGICARALLGRLASCHFWAADRISWQPPLVLQARFTFFNPN
jgi:hypothetical protein